MSSILTERHLQTRVTADGRTRLLDRIQAVLVDGALRQARTAGPWLHLPILPRDDLGAGAAVGGRADSIWDLFRARGGRLVVLGAAGAGKTVAALELVAVALERARADPGAPIPILLDLVEWRPGLGIEGWLLEGLRVHYRVPVRFGKELLARNEVLCLADSLDAVPEANRAACVTQIRELSRARPDLPLVVLSRTDAFEPVAPGLPGPVVEIGPPSVAEVARYGAGSSIAPGQVPTPRSFRPAIAEPGGGSEPLARLLAVEIRARRWWAVSLDRLASVGPSVSGLGAAHRSLVIGATAAAGSVFGLLLGAVAQVARYVAPRTGGSALLAGLLVGIAIALADGIMADMGLVGGSASDLPRVDRSARPWSRAVARLAVTLAAAAGFLALWTVLGGRATLLLTGASLGALAGALSSRVPWRDAVRWSWRSFWHKLLLRTVVALVAGMALMPFAGPRKGSLTALGLGLGLGITSALVAGFKRRIAPPPGHEPPFTSRIGRAVAVGGAIVLGAGAACGLLGLAIAQVAWGGADVSGWLATGLLAAIAAGLTASALVAALYGCLQHVERAALDLVLVRSKIARRPVSRYVDELTDGRLLRSAGTGVTFVDRPMVDALAGTGSGPFPTPTG